MKKVAAAAMALALACGPTAVFAQSQMDGMKGMPMDKMGSDAKGAVHKAKGTVTRVDAKAGVVTLAHGPVPSLNWPPMNMGFKVTDQALLGKVAEGQSVEFEFVQSGKDYVITSVK
ncbi:copper-binding protein [Azohydromonas caseinilytica]|uniref:Copper-binding protein n=1 Tax=Azohydromonas caseinilytica TaxID=2728836 RepID=A0A848FFN4_9BURK|nr:copper-binding protein [Azohydromonas caseinilytica]NML16960.1 copper-binding protein [Azohydromonas caseinilytica]